MIEKIDDKEYWENYYTNKKEPFEPSLFSQYVMEKYVDEGDSLIELGCGNGRDALHFSKKGVKVVAVDQCDNEITYLSNTFGNENLKFMSGDFTSLNSTLSSDHIYSRFTMHSISVEGQQAVISWAREVLADGGHFLLEFRGQKNDLFGKGELVEGDCDAYIYDGHYRRFLDLKKTCNQLEEHGFEIIESFEQQGFSPVGDEDEVFARLVAKKLID